MLKNVLDGYLDGLKGKERDFDLPFLALLPAMGFYDIHFTHGHVEFGKDFIAKKLDSDGVERQYSFQSKAGDISNTEWRNGIQGQMFEAATLTLSHPNFDAMLPNQVVLVCTGRLDFSLRPAHDSFPFFYLSQLQICYPCKISTKM